MANLVNLGCKCGARGGDPSENSHYMIIHPTTPLCSHYCQCAPLHCCIVCWKKSTFCVQSLRIVKAQMKLYKPEENCKILSNIVAGGMIILGTLCRKMIILAEALCSRAEKFRSAVPAACTRPSTYHTDSNHNDSTSNAHWHHSEIKEIRMTISEKYILQDLHITPIQNTMHDSTSSCTPLASHSATQTTII